MKTKSEQDQTAIPMTKYGVILVAIAAMMSLAGIFIAWDFGAVYAGMFYWNYGQPVITQSVAVALGVLLAWGVWRYRSEWKVSPLTLFLIGLIILSLPMTETFGFQMYGARRWIGVGNWLYFPAELVGILLILPQWVRWATNESQKSVTGFLGKFRRRIPPSAAFTLTLIAVNGLFIFQRFSCGLYLVNCIGLLLWFFGRQRMLWKIGTGVAFVVLLSMPIRMLHSCYSSRHLGDRPFPQNLVWPRHFTRYFHNKIAERPLWGSGFAPSAPYPHLPPGFDLRQSEFCEHVADIVRLRAGLPGVLTIVVVLTGMGVALIGIVRQPGPPEQRLRRVAFSAYLFFLIAGSAVRTLTDTWLLPAIPFPFLGFGFTVTTTAWLALGLLLREVRHQNS